MHLGFAYYIAADSIVLCQWHNHFIWLIIWKGHKKGEAKQNQMPNNNKKEHLHEAFHFICSQFLPTTRHTICLEPNLLYDIREFSLVYFSTLCPSVCLIFPPK